MYRATGVPGRVRFGGARFGGGRFFPGDAVPMQPEAAPPVGDETQALKAQADYLAEALQEVRARLAELEKRSE